MALKPLMRRNSVPDLQTLAALIEMDTDPKLTRACVEAMVNNETSFFRDQPNFALLAGPVLDHIRELRSDTKKAAYLVGCLLDGARGLLYRHYNVGKRRKVARLDNSNIGYRYIRYGLDAGAGRALFAV